MYSKAAQCVAGGRIAPRLFLLEAVQGGPPRVPASSRREDLPAKRGFGLNTWRIEFSP